MKNEIKILHKKPLLQIKHVTETKELMSDFLLIMIRKIQSLLFDIGKKNAIGDPEIKEIAKKVCREIADNYKDFRIEEVGLAFDLGIKKEFGEYYGINFVSLVNFLKSYRYSKYRNEFFSKNIEPQKALQEKNEPTPDQLEKKIIQGVKRKFYRYQKTNILIDYGSVSYNWLEQNGFINIPIPEKHKIFELSKTRKNKNENFFAKNAIAQSQAARARHLSLQAYFDCLIEKNIDIADIIESGEVIEVDIFKQLTKTK
jgi:hypothetical protein